MWEPTSLLDHLFRKQTAADVVLEIFPVQPALLGDRLFESLHARQFVFNADLVELLYDFGLYADSHVLGALHE